MAAALTGITIETNGVTRTLAELGLSEPMVYKKNGVASEFLVKHPGALFDSEPLFANGQRVKVAINGSIVFQGQRIVPIASAEGIYEGYDYVFGDEWKMLEWITFGQRHRIWSVVDGVPQATWVETSEVFLPAKLVTDGGAESMQRITNGEQVREAVQWAIDHGAQLQIGQITPGLLLPLDQKRDLKCSEVIQMMLKLCPDAVCEIDHSTTPPTFNCIQRAQMTPKTIKLSDEKITSLRLTQRDDLTVPAVVLKYKRVDEIDGRQRVTTPFVDAAPAGATGFEPGAIMQTVDLVGGRLTHLTGEVVSEPIPPSSNGGAPDDVDWWIAHGVAWLADEALTEIEITPAQRETDLPYVLLPEGTGVADWMRDDAGNPGVKQSETFEALVSYKANGSWVRNHKITTRLTVTNLVSGAYRTVESAEEAEQPVAGVANAVYQALKTPFFDGPVTVTELECSTDVRLINTLNIAGGTGRYAAMNAVVQEVTYNLTDGQRTFTLGWPKHLSIDDIIEVIRFNRVRHVYSNPALQSSGELEDEGEDVELPGAAMEDASSGAPVYQTFEVAPEDDQGKQIGKVTVGDGSVACIRVTATDSNTKTLTKAATPAPLANGEVRIEDAQGNYISITPSRIAMVKAGVVVFELAAGTDGQRVLLQGNALPKNGVAQFSGTGMCSGTNKVSKAVLREV